MAVNLVSSDLEQLNLLLSAEFEAGPTRPWWLPSFQVLTWIIDVAKII